jgi:membrane protein
MRFVFRVLCDAFMRFLQDDGWAIASHIALSILMSLFPFLIFVTELAGFFGSANLVDEVHELAHILLQTWPQQVAAPIANEIHNVLTQTRSDLLTISVILAIYFSSSGVEAVRIGLNRAYDVRDSRPWWLLRLESFAYIGVGAFALHACFPCGPRALDLDGRAALRARS